MQARRCECCCDSIAAMQSLPRINLRAVTWAAIIAIVLFFLVESMLGVYLGSHGMEIHPAWLFHVAILLGAVFIVAVGTLVWLGRSRK